MTYLKVCNFILIPCYRRQKTWLRHGSPTIVANVKGLYPLRAGQPHSLELRASRIYVVYNLHLCRITWISVLMCPRTSEFKNNILSSATLRYMLYRASNEVQWMKLLLKRPNRARRAYCFLFSNYLHWRIIHSQPHKNTHLKVKWNVQYNQLSI